MWCPTSPTRPCRSRFSTWRALQATLWRGTSGRVPPASGGLSGPEVEPFEGAPLIYCGNLDGYQNIELLMKTMQRLPRDYPLSYDHARAARGW